MVQQCTWANYTKNLYWKWKFEGWPWKERWWLSPKASCEAAVVVIESFGSSSDPCGAPWLTSVSSRSAVHVDKKHISVLVPTVYNSWRIQIKLSLLAMILEAHDIITTHIWVLTLFCPQQIKSCKILKLKAPPSYLKQILTPLKMLNRLAERVFQLVLQQ